MQLGGHSPHDVERDGREQIREGTTARAGRLREGGGPDVLSRLNSAAGAPRREIRVCRLGLRDPRAPRVPKALPGHLDDLTVVPAPVLPATWMVPEDVVAESCARAKGSDPTS